MKKIDLKKDVARGFLFIILILEPFLGGLAFSAPATEFDRALDFYRKKEFAQALSIWEKTGEEGPQSSSWADGLFMQGQALKALKKWPEAAQVFAKAAAVHPTLGDYALFYQGEALQAVGEILPGLEVWQRLITRYPQSLLAPRAGLKMAELFNQNKAHAQAVEACERLLQQGQTKDYRIQALMILGQAREGLEQWGEAEKTYRELWLKYPLHPLGSKGKERRDALVKERKAFPEKLPAEALWRRAVLLYEGRQYETALGELERIEDFPLQDYPGRYAGERWVDELYYHRGMCLFNLKRYALAAEVFNLVIQHSKNEEMAEKSVYWMARSLFRVGRKEEALGYLDLLQKTYPQSSWGDRALNLKATVFQEWGDIEKAVVLFQKIPEKFPQSSLRFSGLWQAGWLLYKNKNLSGAIRTWDRLQELNPSASWMEKVLYWKARALEKLDRKGEAEGHYRQLLKNHPASYYSQLASLRGRTYIQGKRKFSPLQDQALPPSGAEKAVSATAGHLEKGKVLTRLGLLSEAVEELEAAEEEGNAASEMRLEISRLYREAGDYYRSVSLARKNFPLKSTGETSSGNHGIYQRLAYPFGHPDLVNRYSQNRNLDPALLSAVILEESRFNAGAVSVAGARGLMQVMPGTGRKIAQQIRVSPFSETLLFDPETNIRMGSWYLAGLLDEFGGKESFALAAYNAGPHVLREWLAQKGPTVREDEFVESIPYAETRNYVIRVLSSAQMYRMLYRPTKGSGNP
jgi:soluble lytic murein transglycosylase